MLSYITIPRVDGHIKTEPISLLPSPSGLYLTTAPASRAANRTVPHWPTLTWRHLRQASANQQTGHMSHMAIDAQTHGKMGHMQHWHATILFYVLQSFYISFSLYPLIYLSGRLRVRQWVRNAFTLPGKCRDNTKVQWVHIFREGTLKFDWWILTLTLSSPLKCKNYSDSLY